MLLSRILVLQERWVCSGRCCGSFWSPTLQRNTRESIRGKESILSNHRDCLPPARSVVISHAFVCFLPFAWMLRGYAFGRVCLSPVWAPTFEGVKYSIEAFLSLWLSGLIRFLSHSTCWALLADDLRWPGFKSRSGREFLVGWTNGRYATRLISPTGTECPPVSSLNCDRCRLWSYDIATGYKCDCYYYYY